MTEPCSSSLRFFHNLIRLPLIWGTYWSTRSIDSEFLTTALVEGQDFLVLCAAAKPLWWDLAPDFFQVPRDLENIEVMEAVAKNFFGRPPIFLFGPNIRAGLKLFSAHELATQTRSCYVDGSVLIEGDSALTYFLRNGTYSIDIQALIEAKVPVNAQNAHGTTALMIEISNELLVAGADPALKDKLGRNAAFAAVQRGDSGGLECLLGVVGKKVLLSLLNETTTGGLNGFQSAKLFGRSHLVEFLNETFPKKVEVRD